MTTPPARARSWAPALLVAHAVLAGVLVGLSLVLLGIGTGDRALGGQVAAVVVGLLVVGLVVRRHGPRRQTRGGRWTAVAGVVVVVPWVWSVLGLTGLSARTAPLLAVLPLYLWPLAVLVLGAAVVVACLDLAAGEVLHRRRG